MNIPKSKPSFYHFPDHTLEKLGFEQIRSLLKELCISSLGQAEADRMGFSTDLQEIEQLLDEIEEFKYIRFNNLNFPVTDYLDVSDILRMLEIPNSVLSPEDLLQLYLFLNTINRIFQFLTKYRSDLPNLYALIEALEDLSFYAKQLEKIVDPDGNIRDQASKKLYELRLSILQKDREILNKFEKAVLECRANGWLSSDEESIRQGERVIAVQSKFKRKLKGLILDESSSGRISFIQPEATISLRNQLFELKQEEKREVFRILKQFSLEIRPYADVFRSYINLLGKVDLVRSKALLSINLKAVKPQLCKDAVLRLQQAYHPLLYLKNNQEGKETVPLSIGLGEDFNILIVSGPNAGGKSVCLKTIGLIQLMFQAGLQIPVDPNSKVGVFKQLFVDIGDDQSIQDELSTYSSRLKSMDHFIRNANKHTLFLVDEFGSGTDPQLGGMIAEVLLDHLNKSKARGAVTTHYSNLKLYASNTAGVENGAMRFDLQTLNPTFQLIIGELGSSYSYEIVKKTGFEAHVVEEIGYKLNKEQLSLDKLILDLQKEKQQIDDIKQKLVVQQNKLNELLNTNKELKQQLNASKSDMMMLTKKRADDYLDNINKRFEKLVRDWTQKDEKTKKEGIKFVKEKIEEEKRSIQKGKSKISKKKTHQPDLNVPIEVGYEVRVKGGKQSGEVLELKAEKAVVLFGNLKTTIPKDELEVIRKVPQKKEHQVVVKYNKSLTRKFSPILDIRGVRRDEAIKQTEDFIDEALMSHFKSLKIIHGLGNGVLRSAVRTTLKKYSFIKDIRSETEMQGGDGVTLIEIE